MRSCVHAMVVVLLSVAAAQAGTALERGDFEFGYPTGKRIISVRCRPMQWLDDTFCLSEGDPSMFVFTFGNPAEEKVKDPHLMVALPGQVKVTGMHVQLALESSTPWEAGRVLHDFRLPRPASAFASPKGVAHSRGVGVLVETAAKAGAPLPHMVYWFRDGHRESPRLVLRLRVLPPIRARMPKDFKVGIMPRKPTFYLRGEGADRFGGFLKRAGIGWVIAGRNAPTTLSCMKAGLDVACEAGLANGYMLGWKMHPEDVAFYLATGDRFRRAVCPTAIARRHPYIEEHLYQNIVHKLIAKDRTCRHLTTNWEPYMFLSKGCFCPRCRDAFVAWSKLPADEVEKGWPLEIAKKRKALYEKFFAWQHGQVLITLEKMCRQAGKEVGVESHFFPQVAYTLFDPAKKDEYYHRLTDVEQYADELSWIQPWGGYMTWDIVQPRRRGVAKRLYLEQGTAMARRWAENHARDGRRHTISWGVGTYLGTTTCTFPEGVEFDILCCLVNGIDRTAAYVFPMGYDNRYWAAEARAADTAARFEDFIRKGKRVSRHVIEPVSPLPKVEDGPVLRSHEFDRPDGRLIAVGNFWEEGEAFFRLKLTDVPEGARMTISEPTEHRHFLSPSGEPVWTARELSGGALLHVGKLRWVFAVIRPAGKAPPKGNGISQEAVAAVMKERGATLKRDHDMTMKIIADMEKARTGEAGDYSKLRPFRQGDWRCAIRDVNRDGKPEVVYSRKGEELVIEPAKGARVLHWKLDGFDVAYRLGAHSLAVDATWAPAHFVAGEVRVLEHALVPGGMRLVTERTIPKAARGCLPGIKVTRTLFIPDKGGAFRVTTQLTNTGKDLKEFAYRQTATPAALTRLQGGEGWVQLWGKKGPFKFKRNFLKNRYHMAGQPRVERLDGYAMDVSGVVTEPRVRFGCSWNPAQVEARVKDGKLYAFVFWDSGAQAASTAEFVCRNLKLKPGEDWEVTVNWRRVSTP